MGEEPPSDLEVEAAAAPARPLAVVAAAFEDISSLIDCDGDGRGLLRLAPFSNACSLVTVLFGCLGLAFKFAELEYSSKFVEETMDRYFHLVGLQSTNSPTPASFVIELTVTSDLTLDIYDIEPASQTSASISHR